ncbi:vascular-related unknown protein 4-like [Malania oleifera]|uniref:vascular-related unknown protein 4-like n=1 Tax=Malania oleifera TaxID=397392 RepID=UPI0025AE0DC2|nr:vascular-related unknown protein 4-like [Malania oleifera]
MERSLDSMSRADLSSEARTSAAPSDEESGWTIYFEDFLNNNNKKGQMTSSVHADDDHHHYHQYESSSLVSDATSYAAKTKYAHKDVKVPAGRGLSLDSKLSFKKRKTKRPLADDDALEDTASSPVNSPKVYNLKKLDMDLKEKDNMEDISMERGSASRQMDEKSEEFGFVGRDGDCRDLKKRGLCVVPLSLLASYLD